MNMEKARKITFSLLQHLSVLTIIFSPEFLVLHEQMYIVVKQEPCGENKP